MGSFLGVAYQFVTVERTSECLSLRRVVRGDEELGFGIDSAIRAARPQSIESLRYE
jgi:hypothetical protein